jgi:hypothetical protein
LLFVEYAEQAAAREFRDRRRSSFGECELEETFLLREDVNFALPIVI